MLVNRTQIAIRFSDVDALGIVWHGNYLRYFEDGREAFGREFGCTYLDAYREGYVTPIVQVHLDYKRPLGYGDSAIVETTFQDEPAARITFNYRILQNGTDEEIALGSTTQVFLDLQRTLILTVPPFFQAWKQRHGLSGA